MFDTERCCQKWGVQRFFDTNSILICIGLRNFETSRSFQVVSVALRMGRLVQNVFRWTPQFSETFSSFIRRSAPLIASLMMEPIEKSPK